MHHILRTSWLTGLTLASLVATASAQLHPTGLLYRDPRSNPRMLETRPVLRTPGVTLALPSSVDNSAHLPPVRSQGSQGSCAGWGVGYYMKTYQEWQEHGWDTSDPANQFSPAFVYNQINGGDDQGAYFDDAMELVLDHGCCSWLLMPYNQADYVSWPSESAYEDALPHRALQSHYLYVRNDDGINTLKQYLADGNVAVLGINVYPNFDYISVYGYNYCVADRYGTSRGGHAVTLCGYDDNRATNDGPGAFRLVNSWGTGWGESGYFWMSYAAVKNTQLSHGWVYYWTDRTGYEPTLTARFKITHPKRDRIGLTMGVDVDGLGESKSFFNWYMGPNIDRPFPDNNIVFDLSDWTGYLAPDQTNRVFLTCTDYLADGVVGTVEFFQSEYQTWASVASCSDTPAAIPDSSSSVTVNTYISFAPILVASDPPGDGTLSKTSNNIVLLIFDRPIQMPPGDALTVTPVEGGPDLGGLFAYSVESDGVTLRAQENTQVLANQTWYRYAPTPEFEVEPFSVDLCTLWGDANGSGRVTTADYSEVKAHLSEYTDARYDLNGSGRVTTADYSVVKSYMNDRMPTKPLVDMALIPAGDP